MTSADQTFYGSDFGQLQALDPEIAGVLLSELDRIRGGLQLIASENITRPAVLAALGSTLSNKYAEGYPGRRYYGGCSEVDKAETIGIERAKQLFGADHANVQPHSGASANQAVYGAFMPARRHDPRDGPADGWPPDARHEGVLLRQVVQRRALRRRQADRGHRLRPGRELALQHRPKVISPAARPSRGSSTSSASAPSPTRSARSSGSTPPTSSASWPARRSPPGAVRRRGHLHDAQGAARPALRRPRLQGRARRQHGQGGLPDDAGRPADARHRGQGGQLQGGRSRSTRPTPSRSSPTAGSWPRGWGSRASARRPAAPTPTCRCSTCRASASPVRTPRRGPTRPASSSTRTPSRSTRSSRTSPRASGSARRRSRPRAWAWRR